MKNRPIAIDLFCGAGGVTLGLKNAGFQVAAGVEIREAVSDTYKTNHPEVDLIVKDIRNVSASDFSKIKTSIDLIAGCPPCQGFSQLTEKYKRSDSRNDLALQMARLVVELKPRMVMMENVPGLMTKGKKYLDEFVRILNDNGYICDMGVVQMADYGIPQSRRRFVLLAGKGFRISLPVPTHSNNPGKSSKAKPWVTLFDAIGSMPKPVDLSYANQNGGPEKYQWHIIRNLTPLSLKRLKALKAGESRFALPRHLRPECHKKNSQGFQNVYGKLSWKKVSSTITSGCTTPCMGRYGHPRAARTISVLEAAMIQTFPKYYKFKTQYMDVACDMVGNALPPKFASIAARRCMRALKDNGGANA